MELKDSHRQWKR